MNKRYIEISDTVASSDFQVSGDKGVWAEFTYMGDCGPCLRHQPSSVEKGKAQFFWDRNARALTPGWYQLTIFVNKCPCQNYPLLVSAPCEAKWIGDNDRTEGCDGCDTLPKAPQQCCSVVIRKDRCEPEICPTEDKRPLVYTPNYEV